MASKDGRRPRRGRRRRRGWPGGLLGLALALAVACGRPSPTLDLERVLRRTPAQLTARWGEPDISIRKSESRRTLQWRDVEGTWVFVACDEDSAIYVSYTFQSMDPFSEEEAFRRIGLAPPAAETPEHVWANGARRWIPFRQYRRLTVNPTTKAITVSLEEPPAEDARPPAGSAEDE